MSLWTPRWKKRKRVPTDHHYLPPLRFNFVWLVVRCDQQQQKLSMGLFCSLLRTRHLMTNTDPVFVAAVYRRFTEYNHLLMERPTAWGKSKWINHLLGKLISLIKPKRIQMSSLIKHTFWWLAEMMAIIPGRALLCFSITDPSVSSWAVFVPK